MKKVWLILIVLGILAILFTAITYPPYQRDMNVAREKIIAAGSQVVDTPYGPIEYSTFGEGYPVLVVHGIYGGFDQGLGQAHSYIGDGFYSIALSRFGYLGTPLPANSSPAMQADAYVHLLDALDIDRVAIVGDSAGGTSAIQFALRHPDRCSALVLISTNVPSNPALPPETVMALLLKSDFIFWMMKTYFRSSLMSIMGVPEGFPLTPEHEKHVSEIMDSIFPVTLRSEGVLFDMYVSNPDIKDYPLERITVPTLMIHATDDPMTPFSLAQSMAQQIPGAKLVALESGGHLLLGQWEKVRSAIGEFLKQHSQ